MINGIIIAILCIILFLLIHFVYLNLKKSNVEYGSPFRKYFSYAWLFLIISLFLLPMYIGLFFLIPEYFFLPFIRLIRLFGSLENVNFLNGLIVYSILSFLYLNFYYIVDRSVSSKIMIKIENSPQKKLTFEQIKEIYNVESKYIDELNGMIQGGFIIETKGYYKNTFKGSCYSRIMRFLKKYFKLGLGG